MLKNLLLRELGKNENIENLLENKFLQLSLSNSYDFTPFHCSSVNCCDLDPVESRYLLSGGDDGAIGIHDLHYNNTFPGAQFKLISSSRDTKHPNVASLQWYPSDTGLFLSSGQDKLLKIWDTNSMSVATEFRFRSDIKSHKMSPSKLLVAVCNRDRVQIVDLHSGSYIQKLNGGHVDDVIDVCWSPRNEHQLISAGKDGELVMWDIRRMRSCCFKFKRKDPPHDKAHKGAIVGINCLSDCLHLLSLSRGGSVALWDLFGGQQMETHYDKVPNISSSKVTIATSPHHAFIPSGNYIAVVDIFTGLKKHVLKGHLGRVTAVLHQWPQQRLISTSTDRNILYWHSQQATEPVDTPTNLTHAELLERQSGGVVGSACIDYFHYTAEEYYKDAAGEVVEASNKDSLSHLLQDNWSDDDE